MGDGDCGRCRCRSCCLCCCICCAKAVCNWYAFLAGVALAAVLVAAFGVALPVRAAVTDASLARLDLVGGGPRNGNAAVSLAYNLSLTVVLRNRNWAMRAELAAPLDAELRLAGRRFGGARLAPAGRRIAPRGAEELRVVAVSPSPRGAALIGDGGGDGDAAEELARERSAGVFELELRLAGEVRYRPVHVGRSRRLVRLEATCPVKMLMAPAAPTAPRGTTTHLMVFDKVVTCY